MYLRPLDATRSRIIEELIRSSAAEPIGSPAVLALAGEEATIEMNRLDAPEPARPDEMRIVSGWKFQFEGESDGRESGLLTRLDITSITDGAASEVRLTPEVRPGVYVLSQPVMGVYGEPALILVRFEGMETGTAARDQTQAGGN